MLTRSAVRDALYNIEGTGVFQKKKYADIIDRLTTNSVFTVNYMEDNIYEYLSELPPEDFKEIIKEALFLSLNTKFAGGIDVENAFKNLTIRLVSDNVELMHNLNAREHENTVVVFDCEVIATEREKTYTKFCQGYCPLCGQNFDVKSNEDRMIEDTYCTNIKCKKAKLILKKNTLKTDNIQVIYVQEPMVNARNNTPVIFKAILTGKLSGTIFIGQKKRITGIYKSIIDTKDNINEISIEIISERDLEEKNLMELSDEEISELKNETKNEETFIQKITDSYAPLIVGYKDIKLAIMLFLVGGHSKVKREDINMFLIGDPSMAKSELLKFGNKITDKSMYTSGKGSSAAGLTIGLVKMDKGNYVAQAGVLPLCSGGFAFIDEFDKMSTDDRSALHEGMEQQTVSIAKAGFRMTLPAKTPILAAANPKYGKYDSTQTILDNIDIPIPLISRFDMIWLIRDKVDEQSDEEKARFILDTFTGDVEIKTDIFNENKLRSFINYVRQIEPEMTEEVKVRLTEIYKNMRKASDNSNGIAIGTRQLEALVRLTVAHAKLLMKTKTDISDVECVEALFNSMFKEFGMDIQKGSFNQNVFYTTASMTKQQLFDHIWAECKDHEEAVIYSNFIKKLSENEKFDEKSAKMYFDNMERQCVIKHVGDNKWKKI